MRQAVIVVATLAAAVAGLASAVFTGMMCGGDNGRPYAEPGSSRAHACAVLSPALVVTTPGAPMAVLAGALLTGGRWRRRAFLAGLAIAALLVLVPVGVMDAVSPHCDGALLPNAPGCG
jgi:hypothetical protein